MENQKKLTIELSEKPKTVGISLRANGTPELSVFTCDPASPEEVIKARLHRQKHFKELRHDAMRAEPRRFKKGALGLSEAEISAIKWQAERGFFQRATLPDDLRDMRQRFREDFEQRIEQFHKYGAREIARVAESLAVYLADPCARAILNATGEFADMLTQAVIAQRGRKNIPLRLRTELWAECLHFGMSLAGFGLASRWAGKAWGDVPREQPLPHVHRLESLAEQANETGKFLDAFKPKFLERIRHSSSEWLDEADRRIDLRCLLSSGILTRTSRDASKKALLVLLIANPILTTNQVCGRLDAANETDPRRAPIPAAWKAGGATSWLDAYNKFQSRVKTYVSKVRNEAGIRVNHES